MAQRSCCGQEWGGLLSALHTSGKVTGRDGELAALRSLPQRLPTGINDHIVDVAALAGEVPEEASTAFSEH